MAVVFKADGMRLFDLIAVSEEKYRVAFYYALRQHARRRQS